MKFFEVNHLLQYNDYNTTMKNFSHNNVCIYGDIQVHIGKTHIPFIKCDIERTLDKDFIKIKFHRNE